MKVYIGNLSFSTAEERLLRAFGAFGPVSSVRIVRDPLSNQSKGFGFVEMDDEAARRAVAALHGKTIDGRPVRVHPAVERGINPKSPRR